MYTFSFIPKSFTKYHGGRNGEDRKNSFFHIQVLWQSFYKFKDRSSVFIIFFLIEGLHTLEVVLTAGSIHESTNGEV